MKSLFAILLISLLSNIAAGQDLVVRIDHDNLSQFSLLPVSTRPHSSCTISPYNGPGTWYDCSGGILVEKKDNSKITLKWGAGYECVLDRTAALKRCDAKSNADLSKVIFTLDSIKADDIELVSDAGRTFCAKKLLQLKRSVSDPMMADNLQLKEIAIACP